MTAKNTRRAEVATRRAALLTHRRAGKTYQQIVDEHPELGYRSASHASKDAQRALKSVVAEPARELLALEVARIDELWAAIHRKGLAGDLWAIDRLLRMSTVRARLLGLDTEAMRERLLQDADQVVIRGLLGAFDRSLSAAYDELPDDTTND